MSWMMFFYPKENTLKILCWYLNYKCVRKGGSRRGGLGIFESTKKLGRVDISIKSVSGRGVKKGGIWRTLRVPDRRHGGHGHSWCHEWCFFTPRKIPWKFCVDISIRSVSRRGVLGGSWGALIRDMEDRVILDVMDHIFYPKEDTLKVLCLYLY